MKTKIKVIKGDITKVEVDAIINAANETLLGGGGIDGAIHDAAGPELLEECKTLSGCKTGEVKITKGYNLPAKFIIHTVGPIYGAENGYEAELLKNCYFNSLKIAKEKGLKTIAFPAISTGAFRYPKTEAAKVAVNTVKEYIKGELLEFDEVVFVMYSNQDYEIYKNLLNK